MFIHRVTTKGFTHAVLSIDDKPLVTTEKDGTEISLFSWDKNFVAPWRDFAKRFANLAAALKWEVTPEWRAPKKRQSIKGMLAYRYPIIPDDPDNETFIACEDPGYLLVEKPLSETWAMDMIGKPQGFTGTSLAAITISRSGWESVMPAEMRLEPGAGPMLLTFAPRIPFDTNFWIETAEGAPVQGFDVMPSQEFLNCSCEAKHVGLPEGHRMISAFKARHGKYHHEMIADGDVSPNGECWPAEKDV